MRVKWTDRSLQLFVCSLLVSRTEPVRSNFKVLCKLDSLLVCPAAIAFVAEWRKEVNRKNFQFFSSKVCSLCFKDEKYFFSFLKYVNHDSLIDGGRIAETPRLCFTGIHVWASQLEFISVRPRRGWLIKQSADAAAGYEVLVRHWRRIQRCSTARAAVRKPYESRCGCLEDRRRTV